MNIVDLLIYVRETRVYGHTYIHAKVRNATPGWQGVEGSLDGRAVRLRWWGYGRSLQAGGHKYKAYLQYADTGKPVPSKHFSKIS